jgi:hypothetical protein
MNPERMFLGLVRRALIDRGKLAQLCIRVVTLGDLSEAI